MEFGLCVMSLGVGVGVASSPQRLSTTGGSAKCFRGGGCQQPRLGGVSEKGLDGTAPCLERCLVQVNNSVTDTAVRKMANRSAKSSESREEWSFSHHQVIAWDPAKGRPYGALQAMRPTCVFLVSDLCFPNPSPEALGSSQCCFTTEEDLSSPHLHLMSCKSESFWSPLL